MSKQLPLAGWAWTPPVPEKRRARKAKTVASTPPKPAKPLPKREQQRRTRAQAAHQKMVEAQEADRYEQEQRRIYNTARAQIWAIAESDEKSGVKLYAVENPIHVKASRLDRYGSAKSWTDEHGAIRRLSEIRALRDDIMTVGGMPQAVKLYLAERRRVAKDIRAEKKVVRVGKHVARV